MNIDELEKLAKEAKENMSISSSSFQWEYRRATNPTAILELIASHKELYSLLGRTLGAIIREGDGDLLSEVMKTLNKVNGEMR